MAATAVLSRAGRSKPGNRLGHPAPLGL